MYLCFDGTNDSLTMFAHVCIITLLLSVYTRINKKVFINSTIDSVVMVLYIALLIFNSVFFLYLDSFQNIASLTNHIDIRMSDFYKYYRIFFFFSKIIPLLPLGLNLYRRRTIMCIVIFILNLCIIFSPLFIMPILNRYSFGISYFDQKFDILQGFITIFYLFVHIHLIIWYSRYTLRYHSLRHNNTMSGNSTYVWDKTPGHIQNKLTENDGLLRVGVINIPNDGYESTARAKIYANVPELGEQNDENPNEYVADVETSVSRSDVFGVRNASAESQIDKHIYANIEYLKQSASESGVLGASNISVQLQNDEPTYIIMTPLKPKSSRSGVLEAKNFSLELQIDDPIYEEIECRKPSASENDVLGATDISV